MLRVMREGLALQKILRDRFEQQRAKSPSYSLRAFAKRAGVSPTTISLLLSGRRKVSRKLIEKIVWNLSLDPQERAELLGPIPAASTPLTREYLQLTADQYQVVGDWRAFAILGLMEIPGFQNNVAWVAERLQAPVGETERLLRSLKRLGLIVSNSHGELKRAHPSYRTTDDVANVSLRKSHYQNLELAQKSLDLDPLEIRDFTWLTLPLDTSKLPQAKALIRKFQDDFYELINQNAEPEEVYRMAIQFFPLTKNTNSQRRPT